MLTIILFVVLSIYFVSSCTDADKVICVTAFGACGNICACDVLECACCPMCAACLLGASAACCECIFPDWKECNQQQNPCSRFLKNENNFTLDIKYPPYPYFQCCGGIPYDFRDRSCCDGVIYNSKSSTNCCRTGIYPYKYKLCDNCCQESIRSVQLVCCGTPCQRLGGGYDGHAIYCDPSNK